MEIWKDIQGYEGLYQVSNLGRVKSLERTCNKGKGNYHRKERIKRFSKIKSKKNVNNEYYVVALSKDGKQRYYSVHRLVAIAFIPNEESKEYVNHKNENGLDNRVENLEWVSNSENQLYSLYVTKSVKNTIPVVAKDKRNLEIIKEFESMALASKWLIENNKTKDKYSYSGIAKCCKKKIHSYMGYVWEYKKEA